MEEFVTDDDLLQLLDELDSVEDFDSVEPVVGDEMEASNRRYIEIIRKHKNA
ncbi:MAG: hypothetical protein J5972_05760 [Eubacterium sp.]|nr:hypothetical protein [Eubacterium sp.]